MAHALAAARAALFAATRRFVHRGPGAALGFFRTNTAVFVALLNVFSLPFLFRCVTRFVSAWCHNFLCEKRAHLRTPASQRVSCISARLMKWMHLLASHPLPKCLRTD